MQVMVIFEDEDLLLWLRWWMFLMMIKHIQVYDEDAAAKGISVVNVIQSFLLMKTFFQIYFIEMHHFYVLTAPVS